MPKKEPVPSSNVGEYSLNLDSIIRGKDPRTTLMIKNIPNKYTQKMLLQKINDQFRGKYDFFYLPIDFKNKCNVGYAFINFIDPIFILKFFEDLNDKKWEKFNSEKICQLTYGRIQGKNNLVEHFSQSSVMSHHDKKVKPLMLNVAYPSQSYLKEYKKNLLEELQKGEAVVFKKRN